jgi:predicted dehydrogenase
MDADFNLVAAVDPDPDARSLFASKWGVPCFSSLRGLLEECGGIDVFSICSSSESHAAMLTQVLASEPAAVIAEKPLTISVEESDEVEAAYAARRVPLFVNYSRRWDPSWVDFKAGIVSGRFGAFLGASAMYNGGLLNNGSHLLDLLVWLFGVESVERVAHDVVDRDAADPSVSFVVVTTSGAAVQVGCTTKEEYSVFEIDLYFESAVVSVESGGLAWRYRPIEPNSYFAGYRAPARADAEDGRIAEALPALLRDVASHIRTGAPSPRSTRDAVEVQVWCKVIRDQLK